MAISASVLAARSSINAASISVAGGLAVGLTVDQAAPTVLTFTGALTGSITVTFPLAAADVGASWLIINATSGAFTLTLQAASGGGTVVIAQGKSGLVRWDGTNLKAVSSDTALIGAAASGSNADITALTGLTGGITGTGTINFDAIQGNQVALAWGRLTKSFPSDANYTLLAAEYAKPWIEMAGVIGAQRNVVVPLTAGAIWHVFNNTTGGFGVQFIGGSGTGIVVANGKRAIVGVDGVNVVRFSSDV